MTANSKRVIYDCIDNQPPCLGTIGSKIFELSHDSIGPLDDRTVVQAVENAHEVYRDLRHMLGMRSFMVKYGILINSRGKVYIDLPRLQDVLTAIGRKQEPLPPNDPDMRIKVLRRQPFDRGSSPRATIGDLIRNKKTKEEKNVMKTKTQTQPPDDEPVNVKKRFVLFLTPQEAKAWGMLDKNQCHNIELNDLPRHAVEMNVVNRLVAAGHMKTLDTDFTARARFAFVTPPTAFKIVLIEARKSRFVQPRWLKLIDKLLDGEFKLPDSGPVIPAFNNWAKSHFPDIGQGTAYVILTGFNPERKYDHLGLLIADPDNPSKRAGVSLFAVRGFTAYDFLPVGGAVDADPPPAEPSQEQSAKADAPGTGGAATRRSVELVSVKIFDEEDIVEMDDENAERYLKQIHDSLEKLHRQLKVVERVRAKAIEREIAKLEEEAMQKMQRADELKKRLAKTAAPENPEPEKAT